MSNRYARILAAGGTAVLAVTLGVPMALAAGTWTIQPGGGIQATMSSGRFTLTDTVTDSVIYCIRSTASGTIKNGSGLPGYHAGSLSAVSSPSCTYVTPLVAFVQAGDLPWHVNLTSYNAADGVARGTLSHLHLTQSGAGCTSMIDGTSATAGDGRVAFRYTDSTGRLKLLTTGSNLRFYDVSKGCLGIFNDGDPATLSITYTVSPKPTVTSP